MDVEHERVLDLLSDDEIRAHLIVEHGWPRWSAIVFTSSPKHAHRTAHGVEDELNARGVFMDVEYAKAEVEALLQECTAKGVSDRTTAAVIVDHFQTGSELFSLVRRARRP